MGWLVCAIIANVLANVMLKNGSVQIAAGPQHGGGVVGSLSAMALNPFFWAGLASAAALLLFYALALRTVPISIAYPVTTSVAMVGIALFGAVLFGESLNATKVGGIAAIIVGVVLMAR